MNSQAGSIDRTTRTGEFWEEERLSLQSLSRHRGSKMIKVPSHVANTDKNY